MRISTHTETNCNCGKEYQTKFFTSKVIYYCEQCNIFEVREINCEHDTYPIKMIIANGGVQVRLYCRKCKRLLPGAKKHSDYQLAKLAERTMDDYNTFYDSILSEESKQISEFTKNKSDLLFLEFRSNYDEYLNSPEWKAKREEAFIRDGGQCQICECDAEEVHHLTYEHFKNEFLFELVSLCKNCHKAYYKSSFVEK